MRSLRINILMHANYHTKMGSYQHLMGVVSGGKMALLAAAGPMGLGAIDYALHAGEWM